MVLPALPPRPEVELRASVVDGKLESLFARASLGNRLPLGHGMFLQELRADLVLEPVRISGGAQITVGPEVLGKSLLSLDGDIAWRSGIWEATGKLVIASAAEIDGRVRLNLRPGGPADVDIDGTLDFKRGRSGLTGRVTGWASASAFNAAGTGTLEIAGIPAIEGEILVNSSGVAACADWVFGHRLGFDYRWGAATPSRLGESCDVGRLSVPRVTSRSAAAIAGLVSLPRVVTLDEGLPFAVFAAAGAQDSPDILVRGPGGTEYDSRGDSLIDRPDLFVLHTADGTRTVYVAVPKPVAGDWTVSAAPGSDRITEIRVAEGLRKPRIAAKVTRRGPKRALHFTVAQMRGQRVSFYESTSRKAAGAHPVAEGVSGSGRRVFTPNALGPSQRYIVAVVTQNGLPREQRVVARYRVKRRGLVKRPSHVVVRRSGTNLTIRWRGRRAARGWLADISAGDGRRSSRSLAPSNRRLKISVAPDERISIGIAAVDAYGRRGRQLRLVAAPATCFGERATILGTSGSDILTGTPERDVIAALGGTTRSAAWEETI